MKFTINIINGFMTVNGVTAAISTAGFPQNISYVQFTDSAGGAIIYNDRPALATSFSDPSPYQSYLNAWITAMAAVSPALTLSQAQSVKCGFVNAIYQVKRQLPVSVSTSKGIYPWDASDAALARNITPLVGLLYIDPLNVVINGGPNQTGGLTQLVSDLNTDIAALNTWASHFNTLNSNISSFASTVITDLSNLSSINSAVNTAFSNLKSSLDGAENGSVALWQASWTTGSISIGTITTPSNPATTSDTSLSSLTETFSAVSSLAVPLIQLIPVGSTSPVSLTPTDLQAIVVAISAQNIKYQQTSLSKQSAINALSTISAVSSYDATAGW